jgi:hypothetical protein
MWGAVWFQRGANLEAGNENAFSAFVFFASSVVNPLLFFKVSAMRLL